MLTQAFDADLARLRTLSAMQTKALRDDRRASLQSGQRTAARLAGELRELQKAMESSNATLQAQLDSIDARRKMAVKMAPRAAVSLLPAPTAQEVAAARAMQRRYRAVRPDGVAASAWCPQARRDKFVRGTYTGTAPPPTERSHHQHHEGKHQIHHNRRGSWGGVVPDASMHHVAPELLAASAAAEPPAAAEEPHHEHHEGQHQVHHQRRGTWAGQQVDARSMTTIAPELLGDGGGEEAAAEGGEAAAATESPLPGRRDSQHFLSILLV